MSSPELRLVDHLSGMTAAAGLTLGILGNIEYYYGDEQKSKTINKTSIYMSIAYIALTATGIFIRARSKKQ